MSDPTAVPAALRWPATTPARNRTGTLLLGVFGLLAVANLVAGAADTAGVAGGRLAELLSKPLLMPVLAGFVVAAARPGRPLRLAVAGLLFGGAGDAALLGHGAWFLVGMGAFALGHVCYLLAFLRAGAGAALRRRWWILLGYLAVWAVLLFLVWPGLNAGLRLPVLGYSLLLTSMAAAGGGAGGIAAAGGALFLLSDGLLALGLADRDFPGRAAAVMPTYLAAQLLIAVALLPRRAPAGTADGQGAA
jgi:uncharacterized membrane protein YhhN